MTSVDASERVSQLLRYADPRRLAALAVVCLVCLACLGVSSAQAAGPQTSAVLFADPGAQNTIGESTTQRFDAANGGQVTATTQDGSSEPHPPNNLDVTLSGGTIGAAGPVAIGFYVPVGDVLEPGSYADADASASGFPASDPGILMSTGSEEAGGTGAFEIKDLAVDASGSVERLWLVFEFRPAGSALAAVFGEVRIDEPVAPGTLESEPALVRWPELDLGQQASAVPVTIAATATAPAITSVTVDGPAASSFPITQDGCTGATLAAGASCQVWVDYAPTQAGVADATLAVTDANGGTADIPLEGLAHGGATFLQYVSQPGDYVGDGGTALATPADWSFFVRGSSDPANSADFPPGGTSSLELDLAQGFTAADSASVALTAPIGEAFTVGETYTPASGASFMATSGDDACGSSEFSYTITDLSFYADGLPHSFAANFIQQCTDPTSAAAGYPALCGKVSWRVGDTQPPDLYSPADSGDDAGIQVPSDTGTTGAPCATTGPSGPSGAGPTAAGPTAAAPTVGGQSGSPGAAASSAGSSAQRPAAPAAPAAPKRCIEPSLDRHTLAWAERALEHAGCRAHARRIAAKASLRGRVVRASGHPRERLAFRHAVILDIGR
jgi:hypothetical protein